MDTPNRAGILSHRPTTHHQTTTWGSEEIVPHFESFQPGLQREGRAESRERPGGEEQRASASSRIQRLRNARPCEDGSRERWRVASPVVEDDGATHAVREACRGTPSGPW